MVKLLSTLTIVAGLAITTLAHSSHAPYKKHTIKARGIQASFIEYGATLTVGKAIQPCSFR